MVARDTAKDAVRVSCPRQHTQVGATDISFAMPDDFCPDEHSRHSFGVIRDDACPPAHVELKAFDSKRRYFRSLPLHHSQEEVVNGAEFPVFRYYLSPAYDFKQKILSHVYEVEVLSPAEQNGEIRWIAETIASR